MPETWELHQLYTLKLFSDGTHSKGDADISHLTFTQKFKCGGKLVSISLQVPSISKAILV
jgi:hypothetical protein